MVETSQETEVSSSQANIATDSRPVYEVGFLLVPELDEAGVATAVESIRAEIKKGEAEIISEGSPQKKVLTYTIERTTTAKRAKYNDAYFGFIKFATEREHIPALETFLRSAKDIMRHLLIETTREELVAAPRRTTFVSDRLEGEVIKKPVAEAEKKSDVSEEELDKSIEALVA